MGKATATGGLLGLMLVSALQAQDQKPNETISIPGTDLQFEMVYVPGGKAKIGSAENEAGRKPDEFSWIKETAGSRTHLTGSRKPNAFGLCDLMGNVWEYSLEFHSGTDYRPVLRGGGWNTPAAELRFAARQEIRPEWFERDPN